MTIRATAVLAVLAVAPLVPLALTWVRVLNGGNLETSSTTRVRVEMALVTLSFALLMCSLIWTPILGPDYSRKRLGVIYGSVALMVLVAIASASGAKQLKAQVIDIFSLWKALHRVWN